MVRSILGRRAATASSRTADRISVRRGSAALGGGRLYDTSYCDRHAGRSESLHPHGDCSIRSLWGCSRSSGARAGQDDAVGADQQREDDARRPGRTGAVACNGGAAVGRLHRLRTRGPVMASSSTKDDPGSDAAGLQVRLRHRHRSRDGAARLNEDIIRAISGRRGSRSSCWSGASRPSATG